ncbi:MAG: hypothetical protein PF569_04920 [Candidatus Woesearchaeota archaeon]|jgi:hypothetical protein|nr:hypothetical protein [Candidatus Woesearchaeota archaeon]
MRITTKSLTKNQALINRAYSTADSVNQLCLIDFENKKIYMKSTNNINICFDIEVEDYDSSICEKLITDASKLLTVCNMYDELDVVNLDGKIAFSNGDNKFQLSYFEDVKIIPTSLFDRDYEVDIKLEIDELLEKAFKLGLTYVSKDPNANQVHHHAGIIKGKLAVLTELSDILMLDLGDYEDCNIHRDVLDYINILSSQVESDVTLSITESHYIIETSNNVKIITPHIVDMKFPDIMSEAFIDFYTHETSFVVNKTKMLDFLSSVKSFTTDLVNNRLDFSIKGKELILNTAGKDKITIKFELESTNNIPEDFTFIFEGALFAKNLKNIEGDLVTIEVGQGTKMNKGVEKDAILCQMYSEDKDTKIIFKRLSDK